MPNLGAQANHLPRASPFPVDFDGDGKTSIADRIAFQLWIEGGGDQTEALLSAPLVEGPEGSVLDVSQYLTNLARIWSDKLDAQSELATPEASQQQAQAGCGVDTRVTILDEGPAANFPLVQQIKIWKGKDGTPPDQVVNGFAVSWPSPAYNDAVQGWTVAPATPIGYPTQSVQHFLDDMKGQYATFYARIKFSLPSTPAQGFDAAIHDTIEADLGVNDGFVAFLNGREIRRAQAPGNFLGPLPASNALATRSSAVTTRLSGYSDILLPGPQPYSTQALVGSTNVLAVHVLNRGLIDSACIFSPRIVARKRGPFIAKASAQSSSGPASSQSTGFEVVVRTTANPLVVYKVGNDPTQQFSNQVIKDDSEFGDSIVTVVRVQVPGAFDGVPNSVLPASTQITYEVWLQNQGVFDDSSFVHTTPGNIVEPFSFWAFGNSGLVGTFGNKPGIGDPGLHQANLANVMETVTDPSGIKPALVVGAGNLVIRNSVPSAIAPTRQTMTTMTWWTPTIPIARSQVLPVPELPRYVSRLIEGRSP